MVIVPGPNSFETSAKIDILFRECDSDLFCGENYPANFVVQNPDPLDGETYQCPAVVELEKEASDEKKKALSKKSARDPCEALASSAPSVSIVGREPRQWPSAVVSRANGRSGQ